MAIISVLLASLFIAVANFFMRRSLDAGGTTKTYLFIQMLIAFLVAFLLGPLKTGEYAMNAPIVYLGLFSGIILAFMLCALGKSLEYGPPGLTFSILSSATVMPAILMALCFGDALRFTYTIWHGIGSILVIAGLFWAGKGLEGMRDRQSWLFFVVLMFSLHVLLLVVYQWRAIVLGATNTRELTRLFTSEEIRSQWFTPMIYLGAVLVQSLLFLRTQPLRPQGREWLYGCIGGACNGLCTFFLIQATELASGLQTAVIFPLFSIGTILFSNLWGQYLYQEKVHWRACQVCASGILIATVDWTVVAAAIGF